MKLKFKINNQQIGECLSECLKSVFSYWNVKIDINEIVKKISKNSTKLYDWDFNAGSLAREKKLQAIIFSLVYQIFDPSWHHLTSVQLINKLKKEQRHLKQVQKKVIKRTYRDFIGYDLNFLNYYIKGICKAESFLKARGKLKLQPISKDLIKSLLKKKIPLIVSHNSTLLQKQKRCYENKPDDIRGYAWGHVVVVFGFQNKDNSFFIADPDGKFNKGKLYYKVNQDLLIESILRYNGQILAIYR